MQILRAIVVLVTGTNMHSKIMKMYTKGYKPNPISGLWLTLGSFKQVFNVLLL